MAQRYIPCQLLITISTYFVICYCTAVICFSIRMGQRYKAFKLYWHSGIFLVNCYVAAVHTLSTVISQRHISSLLINVSVT